MDERQREGLTPYIADIASELDRGNRDIRALLPVLEQARYQLCGQDRELQRLRDLEVKWMRALAARPLVGDLMLAAHAAAEFLHDECRDKHGDVYVEPLRAAITALQELGPMERPITEADLERFRKGK